MERSTEATAEDGNERRPKYSLTDSSDLLPLQNEHRTYVRQGNVIRSASAFAIAICVAMLGANGWSIYHTRSQEIEQVKIANENLVAGVTQRLEASLSEVDHVLNILKFELERVNSTPATLDHLQPLLVNLVAQMSQLKGLFVYSKEGKWIGSSEATWDPHLNNSDRDYFQFHRQNPSSGTRIGTPIVSRSSGEWVIPMTKRLVDPDGNFDGVVSATLSVTHLQDMLAMFHIGQAGAIAVSLQGADTTHILVRRPSVAEYGGRAPGTGWLQAHFRTARSGTIEGISPVDGVQRLFSFEHTPSFPVLVTVALSHDEILTQWRNASYVQSLWVLLVCAAFGIAGAYLVRSIRERVQAESGLRALRNKLAAANERLAHLALYDGLTGLLNRRYFDKRLSHAFAQAHLHGGSPALLMIDVDNFKSYNDSFGHPQGDECLKAVASAVAGVSLHKGAVSARYGGEEFVVLLPASDSTDARQTGEAIRAAVAELKLPHLAFGLGLVSVSVGAAIANPAEEGTPAALLKAADEALYMAKHRGRNQVCLAGDASEVALAFAL